MRIWVTRPDPDGETFAELLRQKGHEVVVEPLMVVHWLSPKLQILLDAPLLVATSRNAIRGLSKVDVSAEERSQIARRKLVVVGAGTAEEARAFGFEDLVVGPGTASELPRVIAALMADPSAPQPGNVIILRGRNVAFDLAKALGEQGVGAQEVVLYATQATDAPSERLAREIAAGDVNGVVLFSPKTAAVYVERLTAKRLASSASRIRHYCLSAAVAAELAGLEGVEPIVSAKPNVKDIIEVIG